jgi:hypothetical protein
MGAQKRTLRCRDPRTSIWSKGLRIEDGCSIVWGMDFVAGDESSVGQGKGVIIGDGSSIVWGLDFVAGDESSVVQGKGVLLLIDLEVYELSVETPTFESRFCNIGIDAEPLTEVIGAAITREQEPRDGLLAVISMHALRSLIPTFHLCDPTRCPTRHPRNPRIQFRDIHCMWSNVPVRCKSPQFTTQMMRWLIERSTILYNLKCKCLDPY